MDVDQLYDSVWYLITAFSKGLNCEALDTN